VKPKTKILLLLAAFVVPYMALVMYFAFQYRNLPFPPWFPYFGLSYILGGSILFAVLRQRIARKAPPGSLEKLKPSIKRRLLVWQGYLIVVWSALLLWGIYETIMGEYPWQRTLPAGAFLLAFIVLFSLSFKQLKKAPTQDPTSTSQEPQSRPGDNSQL
jgi:hypothetical protein